MDPYLSLLLDSRSNGLGSSASPPCPPSFTERLIPGTAEQHHAVRLRGEEDRCSSIIMESMGLESRLLATPRSVTSNRAALAQGPSVSSHRQRRAAQSESRPGKSCQRSVLPCLCMHISTPREEARGGCGYCSYPHLLVLTCLDPSSSVSWRDDRASEHSLKEWPPFLTCRLPSPQVVYLSRRLCIPFWLLLPSSAASDVPLFHQWLSRSISLAAAPLA